MRGTGSAPRTASHHRADRSFDDYRFACNVNVTDHQIAQVWQQLSNKII
ncbi:hypothetical protein [Nocardia farcinica]|nr:hypothetical protein [Nocardia farcinica]